MHAPFLDLLQSRLPTCMLPQQRRPRPATFWLNAAGESPFHHFGLVTCMPPLLRQLRMAT